MSKQLSTAPTIDELLNPVLEAVASSEAVLPEVDESLEPHAAPILVGAAPGFGVVSSPETGLRVLVASYEMIRGSSEYQAHAAVYAAAMGAAANADASMLEAAELALKNTVHEMLHRSYEVDQAGGDEALDDFLLSNLLPYAAQVWALLDAYSQAARLKLPESGDDLEASVDIFGDIDPYAEDGRALIAELWVLVESEMHDAAVHVPYQVMAQRQLKSVSKKAKRHAALRAR